MSHIYSTPLWRICPAALLLTLAGGCAALRPAATPQPSLYSLDSAVVAVSTATRAPTRLPSPTATLMVSPPGAAPGFDSRRIIYVRESHKIEYFSRSEWIDTPARMVAPLIVAAVEKSEAFLAVLPAPSAAAADLRLDTEIVRLQQEFDTPPSRVRFTLRAHIVDTKTRRLLARRDFDETTASASEDPYGGVVAANRAVQTVLEQLARFCAEASGNWPPTATPKGDQGPAPGR
jgi:cholesterol transport system auxiliary component